MDDKIIRESNLGIDGASHIPLAGKHTQGSRAPDRIEVGNGGRQERNFKQVSTVNSYFHGTQ